jgi:hypothetical protein
MLMATRLASRFRKALRLSLATRFDAARGVRRSYRMLQAYERGERRVTESVARAMASHLRDRAAHMLSAAEELEAAVATAERKQG